MGVSKAPLGNRSRVAMNLCLTGIRAMGGTGRHAHQCWGQKLLSGHFGELFGVRPPGDSHAPGVSH
jgi:hypothetical protein